MTITQKKTNKEFFFKVIRECKPLVVERVRF